MAQGVPSTGSVQPQMSLPKERDAYEIRPPEEVDVLARELEVPGGHGPPHAGNPRAAGGVSGREIIGVGLVAVGPGDRRDDLPREEYEDAEDRSHPLRARPSAPLDAPDAVLAGDALERDPPLLCEAQVGEPLGDATHVLRDEDLVCVGQVCDAEGLDHRLAEELVLVLDRLAGV